MTKTIGFIGSGMIGGSLARLAITAGMNVVMSNSRGPETLSDLVGELGDHARAGTPAEAAQAGDLVVATIPLNVYTALPAAALARQDRDRHDELLQRPGRRASSIGQRRVDVQRDGATAPSRFAGGQGLQQHCVPPPAHTGSAVPFPWSAAPCPLPATATTPRSR